MQHFRSINQSEGSVFVYEDACKWISPPHVNNTYNWKLFVDTFEIRVDLQNLQVMLLDDEAAEFWDRSVFLAEWCDARDSWELPENWHTKEWFEQEGFTAWPWTETTEKYFTWEQR